MESRKITIVLTKEQTKKVIMSSAETLGELKEDLTTNGIDYTDMTFYEGLSKTELKSDSSILPKDVPYKDRVTNELVFMITNANKKISSGNNDRINAYKFIKKNNLSKKFMSEYGRSYVICPTVDLINFISANKKPSVKKGVEYIDVQAREAIKIILDNMVIDDIMKKDLDKIAFLNNYTSSYTSTNHKTNCPYSDEEIGNILDED